MAIDRLYAKTGGAWQHVKGAYVKVSGTWQRVRTVYVKVAGAWQQVYGDPTAFVSATGDYVAAGEWTFSYAMESSASELGGGYGTTITVERFDTAVQVAEITDAGQNGSTTVFSDETREYTARLFNKSGVEVDSVTFTISGVPA